MTRPRSLLSRPWVWFLLLLVVVLIAFAIVLPWAVGYSIEQWLRSQGAAETQLASVRVNPLTGQVTIEDLHARTDGEGVLEIPSAAGTVRWLPLTRGIVQLEQLSIVEGQLQLEDPSDALQALVGWFLGRSSQPTGETWQVDIDEMTVTDSLVVLREPGTDIRLLIDTAQLQQAQPGRLQAQGMLNDGRYQVDAELPDRQGAPGTIQFRLQGLSLNTLGDGLDFPEAGNVQGTLDVVSQMRLAESAAGTLELFHEGRLEIQQPYAELAAGPINAERLSWDGTLNATLAAPIGGPRVTAKGQLTSEGWSMSVPEEQTRLRADSMTWSGQLDYGKQDVPTGYEFAGRMMATALSWEDGVARSQLLRAEKLDLQGLRARGTHEIQIERASLEQLTIPGQAEAKGGAENQEFLTASRVVAAQTTARELRFWSVASLQLKDAQGLLHRDSEGEWQAFPVWFSGTATERSAGALRPPFVRVSRLELIDDSRLHLVDEAVSPPFKATAVVNQFSLTNLDSARPLQPSPFALEVELSTGGSVTMEGRVEPLAPRFRLDTQVEIKRLALAPLSAYAQPALGYGLQEGHLSSSYSLDIRGEKFEGDGILLLAGLRANPVQSEALTPLLSALNMPLDSALDLLRDRDNTIRLALPMSGDLSKVSAGIAERFNAALGKAIRAAVIEELPQELLAASTEGLQLRPIEFAPGATQPSADAVDYLERVAAWLQGRPHAQLRICGVAVATDRAAADGLGTAMDKSALQELEALARNRARAVGNLLIREFQVEPARISICPPEVQGEEAVAAVHLLL